MKLSLSKTISDFLSVFPYGSLQQVAKKLLLANMQGFLYVALQGINFGFK